MTRDNGKKLQATAVAAAVAAAATAVAAAVALPHKCYSCKKKAFNHTE